MKRPRTGLADRLRSWAREQEKPFTFQDVVDGLGIKRGREREKFWTPFGKFVGRGEIERVSFFAGGLYHYKQGWHKRILGEKLPKILKAMYLTSEWSANEIMFFAGTRNSNQVHRVIAKLISQGYVQQKGHQKPFSGRGIERVYRVIDRERFRREVL